MALDSKLEDGKEWTTKEKNFLIRRRRETSCALANQIVDYIPRV